MIWHRCRHAGIPSQHRHAMMLTGMTMPRIKKIVLVGHCGADEAMLTDAVRRHVPGIPISCVRDQSVLDRERWSNALLLVNRVLDGTFSTPGGIELIKALVQRSDNPTVMLVSDFPEAQDAASQAGAAAGFGKSELQLTATAERLRKTLG